MYTDTHLPPESHNMHALSFLLSHTYTHSQKHAHSPVVSVRVCSVSVYKYGPETAVMAPASNKQRAEKPPIPASLWPKSRLDGHPTSSRWTISRRPELRYQICVCVCARVYVWISERASKTEERQRGFWYIPHVARNPDTTTPRHKEECYEKERRRGEVSAGEQRELSWVRTGGGGVETTPTLLGEKKKRKSVSCWEF